MIRLRTAAGILATVLLAITLAAGCREEGPRQVDLSRREPVPDNAQTPAGDTLRIAVAGMITPREGYDYYQHFLSYIGAKVGREVSPTFMDDYEETNRQLREGLTDVGFVCSGPYVDGAAEFGLQLLVAPQVKGVPSYYAYIIVPSGSDATDFAGLRGRAFAFTDPASNTGCVYPTYLLARQGLTPESYFSRTIFTQSHDKSIAAVSEGLVDGAAVDSLIYDYLAWMKPELTARTRIVHTSPPFGTPPVTVRAGLDPALVSALRQAFVEAHTDPKGKALLERMMIDRFVPATDSMYDSIREMKRFTAGPPPEVTAAPRR